MAKYVNGIPVAFTTGNICYYHAAGKMLVRMKSSLTGSRVLQSGEFENTRKYAGDMGRASRMASSVYQSLPAGIKSRSLFRTITGNAASLLYSGKEEGEVKEILRKKYMGQE